MNGLNGAEWSEWSEWSSIPPLRLDQEASLSRTIGLIPAEREALQC